MKLKNRKYTRFWPYICVFLWMLRMLGAGITLGLIIIWFKIKFPLSNYNYILGICVTCVLYIILDWLTDWLAFAWKILLSRLAGFRFVEMWFRWLFVKWEKGKLRLKKAKNYNRYGICNMLPPKKEGERYSMLLYYFGGSMGLVGMALVSLTVFLLSDEKATFWMAVLLLFGVLSLLGPIEFVLYKIIITWDDLQLFFRPFMKKAFRMTNQISYSLSMGIWLQDMPEEWFAWEPEFNISNYYTEWLACYRFQYLFYSEQYEQAEQFAEEVLEPKMLATRIKKCLASRMLYIKMLLYNEEGIIKEFYTKAKDILLKTGDSEAYRSLYLYFNYIVKLPETAEKYRVLWEKSLSGQEARDIEMERQQVARIGKKWGEKS